LTDMWEMLARQMTIIFGLSTLGKPMSAIVEEHRRMLEVFRSGDPVDMAREINDHIDVQIHKVDIEKIVAQRRSQADQAASL